MYNSSSSTFRRSTASALDVHLILQRDGLLAHVSPTYQTRAERLDQQEAEAIGVQDDADEQFARDVERSVFRREEYPIIAPVFV
jgi:hypothetical protein